MVTNVPIEFREDDSPADTRLDSNVITSNKNYSYNTLIISGGLHELYHRVDRPILLNRPPIKRRSMKTDDSESRTTEYKKRSTYRAFNNIRRLIYANFGIGSKFLTLTFSDQNSFDITDLKECNKKLNIFIKKLRKLFPNLKYLAKPEFQKRGAVHYHLVINMDYMDKEELTDLWGYGFIDIRTVKSEKEIGPYLSKYLGKSFLDERFNGHKSYFYSNNMIRPRIHRLDKTDEFIKYIRDKELKPDFESWYRNEYSGLTEHSEFHLPAPFDQYE